MLWSFLEGLTGCSWRDFHRFGGLTAKEPQELRLGVSDAHGKTTTEILHVVQNEGLGGCVVQNDDLGGGLELGGS